MIGSVLRGRYELTGLLADGSIFSTFSAKDRVQGRDVSIRIIKVPFSREPELVDRIKKVVAKYGSLRGLNVESLSEVDFDEETVFIVGELTRMPSLGDRIRKLAPFSVPVSVATAMSICRALEVLHRTSIIHGDLNPQNIGIQGDGEARLQLGGIWEAYAGSATAGSIVLPSMAPYLAPEVSAGAQPNVRSDIYAVGILLFELLTGRQPDVGETALATAMKHGSMATPSIREANPSIPAVLDEIVKKAMAKDPADRYKTVTEMFGDLRMLQDALRFGRTVTWPLAAPIDPMSVPVKGSGPAPKPQSVAPRMSAIRDEGEASDKRRTKAERDVPVWMMLLLVFIAAVAMSLLGVFVVFNFSKPRLVTVPNMRGLTVVEARALTDKLKVQIRIGGREPNERMEQDRIVSLAPIPGSKVREGGEIVVTLSAGSRTARVPDLSGMTLDKAKSVLSNLGLELDPQVDRSYDANRRRDEVVGQSPAPGASIQKTTKVRLTLNSDEPPQEPTSYTYTLRIDLRTLQEPTDVRVEMTDDNGNRTIHQDMHNPGDNFELSEKGVGKQAKFAIYYNDRLVKEVTQEAQSTQP